HPAPPPSLERGKVTALTAPEWGERATPRHERANRPHHPRLPLVLRPRGGVIHYHGTSGQGPVLGRARFLAGRHAFVSYAHPGDLPLAADARSSFALDHGAFSARRSGLPSDAPGFLAWVVAR